MLFAVMFAFWIIWFMGAESDNVHAISNLENLQHLQERLLIAAAKRRYELQIANPDLGESELDALVDSYIDDMMVMNGIQE